MKSELDCVQARLDLAITDHHPAWLPKERKSILLLIKESSHVLFDMIGYMRIPCILRIHALQTGLSPAGCFPASKLFNRQLPDLV